MAYSSIKKKKCKCSDTCDKWPTLGYSGYFSLHAPEEIKEKVGNKRNVIRRNKNARLSAINKIRKFEREKDGGEKWRSDMWFTARHLEMTGRCLVCGETTCKGTTIFKNSIAHLFPKAYFKSIKWHEDNWVELCFYGNSCHTNFDQSYLTFEDLKHTQAWDAIVRKFKTLYPLMTNKEQGRIPEILLNTLK